MCDSSGCFMFSCYPFFPFWISDHSWKSKGLLWIFSVSWWQGSIFWAFLCPTGKKNPLSHREPLADFLGFNYGLIELWNVQIYKPNPNEMSYISVVCDMSRLRFLGLAHDILLILFISRQVVVTKSHFVNQGFFFRTDYFSNEKISC